MKLNALKLVVIFTLLISSQVFAETKADPKIELLSKENAQLKAKLDDIASTNESLVTVKRQISDALNSIEQNQSDSDKALAKLDKLEQIERDTPDTIPDAVLKEANDNNKKAKSALGKSKDDYDAAVARSKALKSKQTELYDQFQLLKVTFERDIDATTQERLDQSIRVLQADKAVEVSVRTSCSNDEPLKQCKEKSLKSAELSASEKGSVVFLSSLTEIKNFKLSKDEVRSEVQATLSDETSSQKQIATDDTVIIETSLKAKVRPAISDTLRNQLMENIRADIYASAGGRVDYDKVQQPVDSDKKYAVSEKVTTASPVKSATALNKSASPTASYQAPIQARAYARSATETDVIAKVNGVAIPQVRANLRIKVAAEQDQKDSPELRKAIKDDLINLEVISQEAVKNGLSSQPEVIQQIELVKQSALAGAFVQDYTKSHPVSESASKHEYANLKSHLGNKEYKVAHILVETESEARNIATILKNNGDFAKIATEKSKDPGSKDNGGDLGWTVPSNFVQPFADVVLKLGKGKISAPVKTQYGWHIIKLDDVRDLKAPEYETVKANLEKRLQQQSIQEAIKSLRANANIDLGSTPSVNGITIPQTRIELRVKAAAQQGQPDTPELRKAIRDDLINLEVLSQEARKKGLDSQPEVIQQIELGRQSALAGAYVQDYAKTHPISEESTKREYDNQKSHQGNKEYKVAHILVDSEKEARSILAELKKKGGKFDKIATERSKDPGSKDKGGDLGWTVPSNFVQPFGDAVLKLGKGQISAPVQTQFGWHIIKLDDVRDLKAPEYASVKANLERKLQQQSIQEEIKALRANADIQ